MGLPRLVFTSCWRYQSHFLKVSPMGLNGSRRAISWSGASQKQTTTDFVSTSLPDQAIKDDSITIISDAPVINETPYLPPPPLPEPPHATTTADNVGPFVGEVRLYDLGLANSYWRPGSWVQSGLDALHFDLHLPWWQAIMTGTIIVRLGMFPLVIRAQRFMANYANHMPTIMRLQNRMSSAVGSNNPLEAEKLTKEYTDYLKRNNLLSFKQYAPMLAQGFIFMSVFTGLRAMATLPVDSMRTGGAAWFTDLTIADPYFLLPLMTSATLFLTIRMGADGVSTASMPMKWMRTGFQLMPIFILPITAFFPSAMCVYWFTSNAFSLVQVGILRQPKIREYFNIPAMVKHDPKILAEQQASMRNSWSQMREGFRQQSALARARDHQQLEAAVRQQRLREVMDKQLQKTKMPPSSPSSSSSTSSSSPSSGTGSSTNNSNNKSS